MKGKTGFSLTGKIAIVTGGSRGIGEAIALGYAEAGAKVIITSRKTADLEATAVKIRKAGGEAFVLPAHLGRIEEIQKMVNSVMDKYGRIDILVNNAGTSPAMSSVLEVDERLWDTVMNLNLKGVYFVSQAVAKIMKKQNSGKIINIASIDSFIPEPNLSAYSISKAGLLMITKSFARELAPSNIQVNTICPGFTTTKMLLSRWSNLSPEEAARQKEQMCKKHPAQRFGNPEEIVGAAIYLASDASSYTSGAEIVIDGGFLLSTHP